MIPPGSKLGGVTLTYQPQANGLFAVMPREAIERLREEYFFMTGRGGETKYVGCVRSATRARISTRLHRGLGNASASHG
ncbi:MAG: hypothetical protein ACLR8Y_03795 [Alistipes indistinctus]